MSLDVQEVSSRVEDDLSVLDITYASPEGGRVPATLIVPEGLGPFAGLVMKRSMELEFGKRFAEYGAVVIYVDPPSFRPQGTGPRGILTFSAHSLPYTQTILDTGKCEPTEKSPERFQ